jgi:hypothetical protein
MLQRLMSFALPPSWSPSAWPKGALLGVSCAALMGAAWLLPPASVHAQTTVNYNFEDEVMRGTPSQMKVPPKILTENGHSFMRITGSTGDCQAIPSGMCPPRNRSTVTFTSHYASMPLITSANMRQTYSADIRFHDDTGTDGTVFELFQDGPQTGGYGTPDGQGPVVIFWRTDGRVKGRVNYVKGSQLAFNNFDLGAVRSGAWHNYRVVAVWSHDPSQGRVEIYFDGKLKLRVTGRDANLAKTSNRIPALKLGLYGDHAVGRIDVDNVKAGPSTGSSPAPSVALSAPTNVRLASAE